ncbi:dolichyl-phosphate mannose synthase [Niallia nealsonii AAU1]|nr:dolichyl-phosphate mannose synthase [Niallia nealsonii AAU1]
MTSLTNISVLIPAYNPDEKLMVLVKELIKEDFKHIVIINDGSKTESEPIFKTISSFQECKIINHAVNLGKGRALKTGFNYLLNRYKK